MNGLTSARRALRDVADGLRSQPGRTALAFTAVAAATAAATVLLAALEGLEAKARDVVADLGVETFAVLAPAGAPGRGLTGRHAAVLAAGLPACRVAAWRRRDLVLPDGSRAALVAVAGDPGAMGRAGATAGRFLDAADDARRERVAVLSQRVQARGGWHAGDTLPVGAEPFRIVGVAQGSTAPADLLPAVLNVADAVFVPASADPAGDDAPEAERSVDAILVRAPSPATRDAALRTARRLLAAPDLAVGSADWYTVERLLAVIRRLQGAIAATAGSVTLLSLLLAGATLMVLWVANVRQRTAEIGLRRALGATPGNIAALFVLESCVVTGTAAAASTGLTHVLLAAAGPRIPFPLALGVWTLTLPVVIAIVLGALFSLLPARRAARLSPSMALRGE